MGRLGDFFYVISGAIKRNENRIVEQNKIEENRANREKRNFDILVKKIDAYSEMNPLLIPYMQRMVSFVSTSEHGHPEAIRNFFNDMLQKCETQNHVDILSATHTMFVELHEHADSNLSGWNQPDTFVFLGRAINALVMKKNQKVNPQTAKNMEVLFMSSKSAAP